MTECFLVMPRGINVGTRNRVPMAELRSRLTDEGYSGVATVLQSGNVIVSAESTRPDEVTAVVKRLLSEAFDVNVPCVVRTADQVRAVLDRNPLRAVVTDPSRYLVNFLSGKPDPEAAAALLEQDHGPEALAIEGTEAYVWTPDGVKAMTLSYAHLEKRLGVVATARNWNTLGKIVAKF
ncbi:DUF1697 domain-containing protein [Candidatus Poriferisodalis sp.]|uniref:DUF1697 domain-containing protein n=1 Tax=Candidatus Poriferisodalis sp. TaxID=3101277 RepID=UPI003C703AE8